MVPNITGTSGALPSEDSSTGKASLNAMGVGIPDASGSTPAGRLAHLRKSHASQGCSSQASELMLASCRDKTNSNYGSSLAK